MLVVSVVAHVDHGKTTLLDSILSYTRTISKRNAGHLRYLDSRDDEQERGITLKLSFFQANDYIFIDTPGHVDFESLIACSSKMCDSFIFIVDINEGITPRTHSLLELMRNKQCILVLNKIDKLLDNSDMLAIIGNVIQNMNVFLNEEYFDWCKNNIILCSSTKLYGLNCNTFKKIKKNNTLRDALLFIYLLNADKTENANIIEKRKKLFALLSKLNITTYDIKELFPLSTAIFDSLSGITHEEIAKMNSMIRNYISEMVVTDNNHGTVEMPSCEVSDIEQRLNMATISDGQYDKIISAPTNSEKSIDLKDNNDTSQAFDSAHADVLKLKDDPDNVNSIIGLTMYAISDNDNMLFVVKVFVCLTKGMLVYCNTLDESRRCKIENIYMFKQDKLVEIDHAQPPALVAVKGDFIRNSVLSLDKCMLKQNILDIQPFYIKKIRPLVDLNAKLQQIVMCEPILNVKTNKFGEIELFCEGKMHFEKIAYDLEHKFTELPFHDIIYEACGSRETNSVYNIDNMPVNVNIRPSEKMNNEIYVTNSCDEKNDENAKPYKTTETSSIEQHAVQSEIQNVNDQVLPPLSADNKGPHLIANEINNALNVFMNRGTLINEKILFTCFEIRFKDANIKNVIPSFLKILTTAYNKTQPIPILFYYQCKLHVMDQHLGNSYNLLNQYSALLISNEYDEDAGFFVIEFNIHRQVYNNFVDDLKSVCKGMFHIKAREVGYLRYERNFDEIVANERKRKGISEAQIIVANPEKQRTLKK